MVCGIKEKSIILPHTCIAGYCYKYTRATYDCFCGPGSQIIDHTVSLHTGEDKRAAHEKKKGLAAKRKRRIGDEDEAEEEIKREEQRKDSEEDEEEEEEKGPAEDPLATVQPSSAHRSCHGADAAWRNSGCCSEKTWWSWRTEEETETERRGGGEKKSLRTEMLVNWTN